MKKILLIFSLMVLAGCERLTSHDYFMLQGMTMGTHYHVNVLNQERTGKKLPNQTELQRSIQRQLERIEMLMSNWRVESEISRFNRFEVGVPFEVDSQTYTVLKLAQEVSKLTKGAFDISVSPLVELWGFDSQVKLPKKPTQEKISAIMRYISYQYLILIPGSKTIQKQRPITINVSAIAKGYAVDQIANYLLQSGINNFLVEIGGEIRTHGVRANGSPWRIAIEQPDYSENRLKREVERVVLLSDKAIATSGNYRNFFTENGQRYSHILNPITGKAVSHNTVSVSVVDGYTARADALATALMVMGSTEGINFCEKHRIAAYFIDRQDDSFDSIASTAFKKYLTN